MKSQEVPVWWVMLTWLALFVPDAFGARAKDVGHFLGVQDQALEGTGLVVGLRRTGDSPRNEAAIRALATRLQAMGMRLAVDELSSRNIALVYVHTEIPADARVGQRLDVLVSAAGDASSLEGGVLMSTPLYDKRGDIVAIAEGALVTGGYAVDAGGSAARKNTPTTARADRAGLVVREDDAAIDYAKLTEVESILRDPDFTTATRLAEAVDAAFGAELAQPVSASTVKMTIPDELAGQFPRFAAKVEEVQVELDVPARVVVNERTGTVVMGADVRISPVAVAHGGLTVEVLRRNAVSQPPPLSLGTTMPVRNTEVQVREEEGQVSLLEGASIGDLVAALDALGVPPRDLIVILQAIRSAGALQAELVTL